MTLRRRLLRLSNKLTASPHRLARILLAPMAWGQVPPEPVQAPSKPSLLIGPMNYAGQAHQWARSVHRFRPDIFAASISINSPGGFEFPATAQVPARVYAGSYRWQENQWQKLDTFSHIVVDSFGSLRGRGTGPASAQDVAALQQRGVQLAYLCHGSDIRSPRDHAARHPFSPFAHGDWSHLQRITDANQQTLARWEGPVFFSTPDLVLDVPQGTWVPVVVEADAWRNDLPVLTRQVPVVLHVPSNPTIKGSKVVDQICRKLAAEGLIEYQRVTGVPAAEMPELVKGADILIDQLLIGAYGVAACEGMAAGRLVAGYVDAQVRDYIGQQVATDLPMLQVTPDTLESQLRAVLANREPARALAQQGPAYVGAVHSGERSAQVLASWVDETAPEVKAN